MNKATPKHILLLDPLVFHAYSPMIMNTYSTFAAHRNCEEVSRKLRNVEKLVHPYLTFLVSSFIVTVFVCNSIYVGMEQSRIKVPERAYAYNYCKIMTILCKNISSKLVKKRNMYILELLPTLFLLLPSCYYHY